MISILRPCCGKTLWPWCHLYKGRIKSLQRTVARLQDAAKVDIAALAHDRALHPKPTHAPNGVILWENSDAAAWLDFDMSAGKHLQMTPEELFATRAVYEPFGKKRFAKRIDQLKQKEKEFGKTPGQSTGKKLPKGLKKRSRKRLLDPYVNDDDNAGEDEAAYATALI